MVADINTEEIFKQIKKQNGEAFAKILRRNVLLDTPDLKHILEFAGTDAEDAKNLVPVLREIRKKSKKIPETKKEQEIRDPLELLDEAGYDAFYVHNLLQQNSIAKYFKITERLCTFKDPKRYKDYYIIHAVKKNVKSIKRGNPPKREDEYGTSVISIQIAKSGGFISIKNRYNHTVDNPDATFNNNPDNIIPGLTAALKHKFNVDFMTQEATIPNNYRIVRNQLVKFNYEVDDVYYGEKWYSEGSEITKLNPDYEIMLDTVILNTKTVTAKNVHENTKEPNRGLDYVLNNEISGHKIKIEKDKTTTETVISIIDENKNIKELARTKNGSITSLHLYKTSEIYEGFLENNKTLTTLFAEIVGKIGDNCLSNNEVIKEIIAPKLKKLGLSVFWRSTPNLEKLYIPELEEMEGFNFTSMGQITELNVPRLKKIGRVSFCWGPGLKKLYAPELEEIGTSGFKEVRDLQEIVVPKLKKIDSQCFFFTRPVLKRLYAPELENLPPESFRFTKRIKNLYAPKLKITEDTPKCILRAIKLAKLKDGIRNVLGLSHHGANENNFTNFGKKR